MIGCIGNGYDSDCCCGDSSGAEGAAEGAAGVVKVLMVMVNIMMMMVIIHVHLCVCGVIIIVGAAEGADDAGAVVLMTLVQCCS